MSRNTPGRVRGYDFWSLDNSIQIALAIIVELLRAECNSADLSKEIEHWALVSALNDIHFSIPDDWEDSAYAELLNVIDRAIAIVNHHGDYSINDVENWCILNDLRVTGGHLRRHPYPVASVIDFLEGFSSMIKGELPIPPEGESLHFGYLID
ncbi:MAG: hypothetical protein AAF711_14970 [Planctomycetota bacterium]